MTPKLPSKTETVRVVVRCRPLNSKETADGHKNVVEIDSQRGAIEITAEGGAMKTFSFDAVYGPNSKQKDIYEESFRELVQAVIEGFNGTIFAYGQTGTGKTFTMQGVKNDPELKGVIPNSFGHIFGYISQSTDQQYLVRASYLEIYMEDIRDLLAKDQTRKLELKERPDSGVYVKDLSSFVTKNEKEIEQIMDVGNQNRSVGATNMNEQSSRSHAIFIITVECSEIGADNDKHYRVGKLNLVDLAGSERQTKTGAEGDRLKEATKINLSLSALGNVISALVDGKSSHIPYRDSKLTRLLQDSLGGNAKTVMVANIGPASYNSDESLTTLRYASRAKNIKNKPKINEDPKDALLRKFQDEINRLKTALATSGGKSKPKSRKIGSKEDESEDEETVDSELIKEREKLEEEKQKVLNNTSLIAEEKEKLLLDLDEKEKQLRKERETHEALIEQIQKMESKLLTGGKGIVDHTNEQQKALELRRQEIAEEQRREREIKQRLDEQEETALNLTETYNSSQQEAEVKTKKLKKLFSKLQSTKAEIQDIQDVNRKERQELDKTLNELVRELKLRTLIIDNFIPPEEKAKISLRAYFDENDDAWKLKPSTKQVTETMLKRPQCFSDRGQLPPAVSKSELMGNLSKVCFGNFLQVELDMPARTTQDYEEPAVAPKIQAILNAAMEDEGDIDIRPSELKARSKQKASKPSNLKKPSKHSDSNYPKPRGFVYK